MKYIKKVILTVFAVVLGFLVVNHGSAKAIEVNADDETAAAEIQEYLEKVVNGEYETVYDESFSVLMHLNTIEDYQQALKELYGGLHNVEYSVKAEEADVRLYSLYRDGQYLADIRMQKQADGSWVSATVFPKAVDYYLEVPVGMKVRVNGTEMSEAYLAASGVKASNFSGIGNAYTAALVDRYRINSMLAVPTVSSDEEGYTLIRDVANPVLYYGKDGSDDAELKNTLIQYAQTCAQFPAQEASVGSVAAISITDSTWYSRVSGVQNDWFTKHKISEFSNQDVLSVIKQSDSSAIANVVFDYYASNGKVERTWNCGYQMSLVKVNGVWKIAGMGIDSTMNPNSEKIG